MGVEFSSENQPKERKPRGRSKQTLILEAIKERALLDTNKDSSKDDVEKAVFGFLAESAFNPTPETAVVSNTALNHIMKKGWSDMKPVMPPVEFDLKETDPSKQANEILIAVSDGVMPADVATSLINSLASILKIREVTELEDRIKSIEGSLDE